MKELAYLEQSIEEKIRASKRRRGIVIGNSKKLAWAVDELIRLIVINEKGKNK